MESVPFFHSHFFTYFIIPVLIFSARILDVSIGTMRVIFISKGYKLFASLCGFFEVLIWIVAITQIIKNLTNPIYYIVYAGGFATGNFVGILIEEKIALGTVLLRVVTKREFSELTEYLKNNNYGVTLLDAKGLYGTVKILFTIIHRNDLEEVVAFIQKVNPQAFYTVEDVRFVNEKSLFFKNSIIINKKSGFFRRTFRKGK